MGKEANFMPSQLKEVNILKYMNEQKTRISEQLANSAMQQERRLPLANVFGIWH